MTKSTPCPRCGTTMWVGSLHICRAEPQETDYVEPPRPGSRLGTTIALALFVVVVGLVAAWALNSVWGVFK